MNYTNSIMEKKFELILKDAKVLVSNNIAQAKFSNTLSNIQWNILFYAIFKLNKSENNIVEFNIGDFCKDSEIEINNFYSFIKKNLKYIRNLAITTDNKEFQIYSEKSIVVEGEYSKGKITIEFNNNLISEFQNLTKNYTYQDLKTFIAFSSSFSKRMYMYFKSKYFPKNIINTELSIEELKKILGVGINEYKKISHIKKIIIEAFIKDINQFCKEFNLEYKDIKQGKKIIAFNFSIIPKQIKSLTVNEKLLKKTNQVSEEGEQTLYNSVMGITNHTNIDFDIDYFTFFNQTFNKDLTSEDIKNLSPYLKQIKIQIINFCFNYIYVKQETYQWNYMKKLLDTIINKNLSKDFDGVARLYSYIYNKQNSEKDKK